MEDLLRCFIKKAESSSGEEWLRHYLSKALGPADMAEAAAEEANALDKTFLGIIIDSRKMEFRLPEEKLLKLKVSLIEMLAKNKTTVKEMQSLLGALDFATRIMPMGRVFCKSLYHSTIGLKSPRSHIRLSRALKDDLGLWLQFIDQFNGRRCVQEGFQEADALNLFTDAGMDLEGFEADLQFKEKMLLPEKSTLQQWGYPDSEGYSSLSPTSSVDSFSFSPPYPSCSFAEHNYNSFQTSSSKDEDLQTRQATLPEKKNHRRNRAMSHQRQSASEREKMRMRNLSTALQNLRRYLPPAVAPFGKNLTKIETLRLTIRYIAHLADVLGLDDETLMKRREESLRRSMCPVGLSCCQGDMHELCSSARTLLPETFSQYPTSPSVFPEATRPTGKDTNPISAEMYSPQFTDQGLPEETFSPCTMNSTPVHASPVTDMKAFLSKPPVSPDLGFCQDMIDDMWDELENKKLWTPFQTEENLQLQHFC
ncbi:uncharacterized protein RB166_008064 [Leptodactylus fuscus]